MQQSTVVYDKWDGGEFGTIGSTLAPAGTWTGSNAVVYVYKNGSLLDATAIVTLASATSDTKARGTFTQGSLTFAAGDVIDVRVRTNSSWSATTVDLAAFLEIAD